MESIAGLASTSLGGTKRKIQQSIPSGTVKKGIPGAVVRSAELNDHIEIQRRRGEGSKPLFAHITDKQETLADKRDNVSVPENSGSTGCKSKSNRRSTSTKSSSPEHFRHRDDKKNSPPPPPGRRKSSERSTRDERHSSYNRDKHSHSLRYNATKTDKYKRRDKGKTRSPSPSPSKKRPTEKVPYYRDEIRERDRLRRLYGAKNRTSSPSRKYSPVSKRHIDSPKRRRSTSREKYRGRSPYRNYRRDYRGRKSRTRSRTRSPQRRERASHKNSSRTSRERDKERKDDASTATSNVIPATVQYIPIPVPVPAEYTYPFSGWSTPQPPWPVSHHRPPPGSHFEHFPMMPPIRPPAYHALPPPVYPPMTAGGYRPHILQRFPPPRHSTNNYQPRSNSSNYQPRTKKPSS